MKLKGNLSEEEIIRVLDFLLNKEIREYKKIPGHPFKYITTKKEIVNFIGEKSANRIISILLKKGVLKFVFSGDQDFYNLNESEFYDFYNFTTNQILKNRQLTIMEEQNKFNKIIALTGCIIALAALWTFSKQFILEYSNRVSTWFNILVFIIGGLIILTLAFLLGYETATLYIKKKVG